MADQTGTPEKKLTPRQMLRLEGTKRRAEKLFLRLARNEHSTQGIMQRAAQKVEAFTQKENARHAPLLKKLAEQHDETFNELCALVESIEQRSGHRQFSNMIGRYGIRGVANAVEIEPGYTEEQIIKYLKENNMEEYVKVTRELQKNPLKEKKPKVPGISYAGDSGREEYFSSVKPLVGAKASSTTKPREKK